MAVPGGGGEGGRDQGIVPYKIFAFSQFAQNKMTKFDNFSIKMANYKFFAHVEYFFFTFSPPPLSPPQKKKNDADAATACTS